MKLRSTAIHYAICLFAFALLVACDSNTLQEAADGWSTETKHSPVQGDQFIAQTQIELDTLPGAFKQITITCTEKSKQLEVELGLFGDATSDPAFIVTRLGGLELFTGGPMINGKGVTAGSKDPVDASDLVALGGFKNVAMLRQTRGSSDMANSVLAQLPFAVELESNLGTIAYEIPRSQKIMDVVNRCVPSPQPVAAPVAEQPIVDPVEQPASPTTDAQPFAVESEENDTSNSDAPPSPQSSENVAPPPPENLDPQFPFSAQLLDPRGRIVIQSGPSVLSSNVTSVETGTHVHASSKEGKWISIQLEDGRVGFVRQKQLQFE